VCFGGVVTDDPEITIMMAHPELALGAVASVFGNRWPASRASSGLPPIGAFVWSPAPGLLADLGMRRRGIEPLRIVVPPQCGRNSSTGPGEPESEREPMPISLGWASSKGPFLAPG
jgi:hypothetical protein